MSDSDFEPPKKVRQPLAPANRFHATVTPEEEEKMAKGYTPANTNKNTKWAASVFKCWVTERNKRDGERCPTELLEQPQPKEALAR